RLPTSKRNEAWPRGKIRTSPIALGKTSGSWAAVVLAAKIAASSRVMKVMTRVAIALTVLSLPSRAVSARLGNDREGVGITGYVANGRRGRRAASPESGRRTPGVRAARLRGQGGEVSLLGPVLPTSNRPSKVEGAFLRRADSSSVAAW